MVVIQNIPYGIETIVNSKVQPSTGFRRASFPIYLNIVG